MQCCVTSHHSFHCFPKLASGEAGGGSSAQNYGRLEQLMRRVPGANAGLSSLRAGSLDSHRPASKYITAITCQPCHSTLCASSSHCRLRLVLLRATSTQFWRRFGKGASAAAGGKEQAARTGRKAAPNRRPNARNKFSANSAPRPGHQATRPHEGPPRPANGKATSHVIVQRYKSPPRKEGMNCGDRNGDVP